MIFHIKHDVFNSRIKFISVSTQSRDINDVNNFIILESYSFENVLEFQSHQIDNTTSNEAMRDLVINEIRDSSINNDNIKTLSRFRFTLIVLLLNRRFVRTSRFNNKNSRLKRSLVKSTYYCVCERDLIILNHNIQSRYLIIFHDT